MNTFNSHYRLISLVSDHVAASPEPDARLLDQIVELCQNPSSGAADMVLGLLDLSHGASCCSDRLVRCASNKVVLERALVPRSPRDKSAHDKFWDNLSQNASPAAGEIMAAPTPTRSTGSRSQPTRCRSRAR